MFSDNMEEGGGGPVFRNTDIAKRNRERAAEARAEADRAAAEKAAAEKAAREATAAEKAAAELERQRKAKPEPKPKAAVVSRTTTKKPAPKKKSVARDEQPAKTKAKSKASTKAGERAAVNNQFADAAGQAKTKAPTQSELTARETEAAAAVDIVNQMVEKHTAAVSELNERIGGYESRSNALVQAEADAYAALDREAGQLEQLFESLDRADVIAVANYNERAESLNERFETTHTDFTARYAANNQDLDSINAADGVIFKGIDTQLTAANARYERASKALDDLIDRAEISNAEEVKLFKLRKALAGVANREANLIAQYEASAESLALSEAAARAAVKAAAARAKTDKRVSRELGRIEANERAMMNESEAVQAVRKSEPDSARGNAVPGATATGGETSVGILTAAINGGDNILQSIDRIDDATTTERFKIKLDWPFQIKPGGEVLKIDGPTISIYNPLNPAFKGLESGAGVVIEAVLGASDIAAGVNPVDEKTTNKVYGFDPVTGKPGWIDVEQFNAQANVSQRSLKDALTAPWDRANYHGDLDSYGEDLAKHEKLNAALVGEWEAAYAPVAAVRDDLNRRGDALQRLTDNANLRDAGEVDRITKLINDWNVSNDALVSVETDLEKQYAKRFDEADDRVGKLTAEGDRLAFEASRGNNLGESITRFVVPAGVATTALMFIPYGGIAGTAVRAGGKTFKLTAAGAKALAGKTLSAGQIASLRLAAAKQLAITKGIPLAKAVAQMPAWALVTVDGGAAAKALRPLLKKTAKKKPPAKKPAVAAGGAKKPPKNKGGLTNAERGALDKKFPRSRRNELRERAAGKTAPAAGTKAPTIAKPKVKTSRKAINRRKAAETKKAATKRTARAKRAKNRVLAKKGTKSERLAKAADDAAERATARANSRFAAGKKTPKAKKAKAKTSPLLKVTGAAAVVGGSEKLDDAISRPAPEAPTKSKKKTPTKPVTGPGTDPVTAPITDPVTGPGTDPITAPVTDPVTGPGTDPVTAPVTDPVTSPGTDPVTAPITDPVTAPGVDPGTVTITDPITVIVVEPITAPEPGNPTSPVNPVEPGDPAAPEKPKKPGEPEKPGKPTKPTPVKKVGKVKRVRVIPNVSGSPDRVLWLESTAIEPAEITTRFGIAESAVDLATNEKTWGADLSDLVTNEITVKPADAIAITKTVKRGKNKSPNFLIERYPSPTMNSVMKVNGRRVDLYFTGNKGSGTPSKRRKSQRRK